MSDGGFELTHKECTRCGRLLPLEAFYRKGKNGRRAQCKECANELARAYRAARAAAPPKAGAPSQPAAPSGLYEAMKARRAQETWEPPFEW